MVERHGMSNMRPAVLIYDRDMVPGPFFPLPFFRTPELESWSLRPYDSPVQR
jgi:hypothetical protein